MKQVNLALLSALYDNSKDNLYQSIYFPIIKYAIVTKLETSENNAYGKVRDIKEYIEQDFGVYIPEPVIKESLMALSNGWNGFRIHMYTDGYSFKVEQSDSDDAEFISEIGKNSNLLTQRLQELEARYDSFLKENNLDQERSFSDFFGAYTSETLSFLRGYSEGEDFYLDESFVKNARFLTLLRDNKDPLYDTASIILWGNIVAVFLQRDKAGIRINPSPVSYYLDTSLVLGGLDLGTEFERGYSQDLIKVIQDSGSRSCVHRITIEEITQILYSTETSGFPKPHTSIYDAWNRLKLSPVKLNSIRCNLIKHIEELGLIIEEPRLDINKIKTEYRDKPDVKKLELHQQGASELRYIHDVYMRDYIRKQQKGAASMEKVKAYFVTTNRDMQRLFMTQGSSISHFVSPNDVILDLWLHGSNPSQPIRDTIMKANLSRCFLMNERNAKQRMKTITEHYNPSAENFDIARYKSIEAGLLDRSKKVLQNVDKLSKEDIGTEGARIILEQLLLDTKNFISEQEKENKRQLEQKDQTIADLKKQAKLKQDIGQLYERRKGWTLKRLLLWNFIDLVVAIILGILIYKCELFFNAAQQLAQKNNIEISYFPRWFISVVLPILLLFLHRKSRCLLGDNLHLDTHQKKWDEGHPELQEKITQLTQVEERLHIKE